METGSRSAVATTSGLQVKTTEAPFSMTNDSLDLPHNTRSFSDRHSCQSLLVVHMDLSAFGVEHDRTRYLRVTYGSHKILDRFIVIVLLAEG